MQTTDILCIQEHWLLNFEKRLIQDYCENHEYIIKAADDADPRIDHKSIRGYGGTAIIWNKSITDKIKPIDIDNNRICTLLIRTEPPCCLINVYMPSKSTNGDSEYQNTLAEIREIKKTYENTHEVILCGDMNASLIRDNPRDKAFKDFITTEGLLADHSMDSKSTFWHHNGKYQSQIDYILSSKKIMRTNIHEMDPLNTSDHTVLSIKVEVNFPIGETKQSKHKEIRTKPKWDKGDIAAYKSKVKEKVHEVNTQENVTNKLDKLVQILHRAGKKTIPSYRKLKKVKLKHGKGLWNRDISATSKQSKQLFKQWKDSDKKDETLKLELKESKRRLRRLQRQASARIRVEENSRLMTASTTDNKTFYRIIQNQRKSKNENTQVLWIDEKEVTDKLDIMKAWEGHFQDLATPANNSDLKEKSKLAKMQNEIIEESVLQTPEPIRPVTHSEVEKAIRSLNNGKAEDLDGIAAEHLKLAGEAIIPPIADIINDIFIQLDIPDDLKKGSLTPVLKKNKDKRIPGNYRGITVTNSFTKVLEAILKDRIDQIFDPQQSKLQRGFTTKSSSLNAAYLITEVYNYHKEMGKPLILVSLDAQKAFDTVNHEILFNKLYHFGIQDKLWILLRNLYRNSTASIKWEGMLSEDIHLLQGTKQGAKLSTTLYKCYHDTTLQAIERSNLGAAIGPMKVPAPTCADDTALLANTQEEMQAMLNIVNFCTERDLITINPTKSEVLLFGKKTEANLQLGEQDIKENKIVKHLGVHRNQKNKSDIENRIKIGRNTIYSLLGPGLSARRGFSPITAFSLWKTYVVPRILYGLEILDSSKTDMEKLERFQRQICKHLQSLPDRTASVAVYSLLGVEPIESQLDRNILALFMNIARLDTSLENEILSYFTKTQVKNSLYRKVSDISDKYEIGDPEDLFHNPPTKHQWKTHLNTAVRKYWKEKWKEEKQEKVSLQYLHLQDEPVNNPHNIWACINPVEHEVKRAEIKVRLVTGTYMLQSNISKYNQQEMPATCQICNKEDENLSHLLLKCEAYNEERSAFEEKLQQIVAPVDKDILETLRRKCLLLQITLDCTHPDVTQLIGEKPKLLRQIERTTQLYCHKVHMKRADYLSTK